MNKKGFTLTELIAVISILGLLAVLLFPIVTDNIDKSQEKTLEIQKKSIKEASESYVAENVGITIFENNETTEEVILNTLIEEGYLKGDFTNPKTKKKYNLQLSKVVITKNINSYEYQIILE